MISRAEGHTMLINPVSTVVESTKFAEKAHSEFIDMKFRSLIKTLKSIYFELSDDDKKKVDGYIEKYNQLCE